MERFKRASCVVRRLKHNWAAREKLQWIFQNVDEEKSGKEEKKLKVEREAFGGLKKYASSVVHNECEIIEVSH